MSSTYEEDHKKKNRFFEFIIDFMKGINALTIIGLILFIVIPVLLNIFKIGAVFVFPISMLGAFIIFVALLKKS